MKPGQTEVKAMCLIIRNNQDILVGMGFDDIRNQAFGRIVGGGVEFQEKTEDAVRREIREEFNSDLENLSFIEVIVNSFTHKGEQGHQITFLYKGDLVDKSLYQKEKIHVIDTTNFEATWLPIKDILSGKIRLYPEFNLEAVLYD
ncbi:MAG: NUDIX domain-containing protein [Candidatus Falkowbacteria bacterium]|nr:NUDIX domain-containing protein [Candidatus Falkowbacteria bacterium]